MLTQTLVMAGLVPAIHVFGPRRRWKEDVDARDKPAHDEEESASTRPENSLDQKRSRLSRPDQKRRCLCVVPADAVTLGD